MLNLKIARTIQDDYEARAKQFRLRKLAQVSRPRTPIIRKLVWLGKDLTHLAFRLIAQKRNTV
jgi:uncharacterized protein YeeX (DUF496 family)